MGSQGAYMPSSGVMAHCRKGPGFRARRWKQGGWGEWVAIPLWPLLHYTTLYLFVSSHLPSESGELVTKGEGSGPQGYAFWLWSSQAVWLWTGCSFSLNFLTCKMEILSYLLTFNFCPLFSFLKNALCSFPAALQCAYIVDGPKCGIGHPRLKNPFI